MFITDLTHLEDRILHRYLIINNRQATATWLSSMTGGSISHDQITQFLSKNEFTSKELYKHVKKIVSEIESDDT